MSAQRHARESSPRGQHSALLATSSAVSAPRRAVACRSWGGGKRGQKSEQKSEQKNSVRRTKQSLLLPPQTQRAGAEVKDQGGKGGKKQRQAHKTQHAACRLNQRAEKKRSKGINEGNKRKKEAKKRGRGLPGLEQSSAATRGTKKKRGKKTEGGVGRGWSRALLQESCNRACNRCNRAELPQCSRFSERSASMLLQQSTQQRFSRATGLVNAVLVCGLSLSLSLTHTHTHTY